MLVFIVLQGLNLGKNLLTDFHVICKPICDFLLVINSNL